MHMANDPAVRKAIPARGPGTLRDALEVQRITGHFDQSIGDAPRRTRSIGIDFDAVALRIGEIDRLADGMVRGSPYREPGLRGVIQPPSEVSACGKQECCMEQTCFAGRAGACMRILAKFEQNRVIGSELPQAFVPGKNPKAKRMLVEASDGLEISNGETDLANPEWRIRGDHSYLSFFVGHPWGQRDPMFGDGRRAKAPSPVKASTRRPTTHKAGNSQPPLASVKKKPAGPCTVAIAPRRIGITATAAIRGQMPKISAMAPTISQRMVTYASRGGRPNELKN